MTFSIPLSHLMFIMLSWTEQTFHFHGKKCSKMFLINNSPWKRQEIRCSTKLLQVLIFDNFSSDNSILNIFQLKFATQKYSTTKSCLLNHNLSLSFRNNEILVYCLKIRYVILLHVSIKMTISSMLGIGYFLKIAKLNSQQEKPICPNRKN